MAGSLRITMLFRFCTYWIGDIAQNWVWQQREAGEEHLYASRKY